jgi:filamentous hemagglutinin family protein
MKNIHRIAVSQRSLSGKRVHGAGGRAGVRAILAGLLATAGLAQANPTGGTIAAGSVSISGTGTPSVTIDQFSSTAIINWNSFSIGSGELTTFVQPSASSAVLNRVTGGGVSTIDGTLNANGQVFLINGNGIYVGKSGAINTAGFTASTLDISDKDFQKGNLQFNGASTATVQNLGAISALCGDIYLIGQSVDNEGSLSATAGTVGLAAAQSVLIKQSGAQHVFVSPTATTAAAGSVAAGVTNRGSIAATAAELRAANGNMYALAINNGGTIRATTVQQQGGHVYLTSDSGVIVNTGTIDASATAAGGTGGTIQLKTSSSGTVVHHGTILAHGGQGGTGGTVDLSGGNLDFTGGVDLTSPGGKTGGLLLDPQSIDVVGVEGNGVVTTTGTVTTYMPAPNFTGSTLFNQTLEAQLAIANVVVDGITNVTIDAPVTWTNANASTEGDEFANTLTLETGGNARVPGTIVINAPITAHLTDENNTSQPSTSTLARAGLTIDCVGNGFVTTGANGTIDVDNFTLQNGVWQQIVSATPASAKMPGLMSALPSFNVTNDFQLDGTSTFERFAGGNGLNPTAKAPLNSPYQIVDIYGLQGIGSPSDKLLAGSYILNNDINFVAGDPATITNNTINWNGGNGTDGGAGWVPIGEGGTTIKPFTGTFDGNNFTVAGFYLYRPNDDVTGLFGEASGTIKNVTVDVINAEGIGAGGVLVGRLLSGGKVSNSFSTSNVSEPDAPSSPSDGTTTNQSDLPFASLGISVAGGGLIGEVMAGGSVSQSESLITTELLGSAGVSGLTGIGGLVGVNYGTITDCSSQGSGITANSVQGSGASKPTTQSETISLGGLVGTNFGVINGGSSQGVETATAIAGTLGTAQNPGTAPGSEGSILSGVGDFAIGGFVGTNYGTIDGTVTIGGRRGTTVSYQAFTTDDVTGPAGGDVQGGTGSYFVGGFAGLNYGKISNAYSAPQIGGVTDNQGNTLAQGGLVVGNGDIVGASSTLNGGNSTGALGDYAVGGFAGGNFGSITHSGTEDFVGNSGSITGVGTVSVRTHTGTVTLPQPANFSSPLALDSFFIGGFVGLNGSKSVITGSFSSPASATIQFTLDPTNPVPTLATPGDTFTILSDPANGDPLVSTDGNILGGTGYYIVGGFAGGNYGSIVTSYSTGNVLVTGTTNQSNSFYTGGFAGVNSGLITNDYATGNVLSQTTNAPNPNNETGVVGGLIGQQNGGTTSFTYSLGSVSGGTTRGGLVGVQAGGSIAKSFWDTDNNAALNGYSAGGAGALAEPGSALQVDMADVAASVFGTAKWNFTTIWFAPASAGFPTLQGVP